MRISVNFRHKLGYDIERDGIYQNAHLVFVGHYKPRIRESIAYWDCRSFPTRRVRLVVGKQRSMGEQIAHKNAAELQTDLEQLGYTVVIDEIDKMDFSLALQRLIDIIKAEENLGYIPLVNISGSLRLFSAVGYVAALVMDVDCVTVNPDYDINGRERPTTKDHLLLPRLNLEMLADDEAEIILAISLVGVNSIENLLKILHPEFDKTKNPNYTRRGKRYQRKRWHLVHNLDTLEKRGYITRIRDGGKIKISLSLSGMAYFYIVNKKR